VQQLCGVAVPHSEGTDLWLCSSVRARCREMPRSVRLGRFLAVVSNEISSRSIERPETGNSRLLVGHIKSHNSLGAPDSLRSNNEGSALLPKEAIRQRPFK